MPKILIVFYSRTGNTRKVANDITSALSADIEEIKDKNQRKGIIGWLHAGRDAMKKQTAQIEPLQKDPSAYDLVIIGSPVWASTITPAIRTYLEINNKSIKKYAFFATSGSTPIEKTAQAAKAILDKDPLASSGFNEKELKDKETYDRKVSEFVEAVGNIS